MTDPATARPTVGDKLEVMAHRMTDAELRANIETPERTAA